MYLGLLDRESMLSYMFAAAFIKSEANIEWPPHVHRVLKLNTMQLIWWQEGLYAVLIWDLRAVIEWALNCGHNPADLCRSELRWFCVSVLCAWERIYQREAKLHPAERWGFDGWNWNMKWLHNLPARQRQESTGSIPIHTHFVGNNRSNEIWPAENKRGRTAGPISLHKDHFGK